MRLLPEEIKLEFDVFLSQAEVYGVDKLYDARKLCRIFLLDHISDTSYRKDIETIVKEAKK